MIRDPLYSIKYLYLTGVAIKTDTLTSLNIQIYVSYNGNALYSTVIRKCTCKIYQSIVVLYQVIQSIKALQPNMA